MATVAAVWAAPIAEGATWGYEQSTPHDGAGYDPVAIAVSADMSTPFVSTLGDPIEGQPADGRAGQYWYGLKGGSHGAYTLGPVDVANGPQLISELVGTAADGSRGLIRSPTALVTPSAMDNAFWFDVDGAGFNLSAPHTFDSTTFAATPDLGHIAFLAGGAVYRSAPAAPPRWRRWTMAAPRCPRSRSAARRGSRPRRS